MEGNIKHGTAVRRNKLRLAKVACIIFAPLTFVCGYAIVKVLGIFFIHLQNSFDASATVVSFTLSLPISAVFLGGPLYGSLFNILGVLPSYVCAGILMCSGCTLTYWTQSILQVQLCLCTFGIGAGIVNITTLTVIGRCFCKTRSLGMGALAMSGALCGAVGNPVLQMLIDEYSWRGTMIILGAFTLNVIPLALIIKQADAIIQRHKYPDKCLPKDNSTMSFKDSLGIESSKTLKGYYDDIGGIGQSGTTRLPKRNSRKDLILRRVSVASAKAVDAMELSLLKDGLFVVYCIAVGLTICGRLLSGLYFIRYMQSRDVLDHQAAGLATLVEISSFISCPVTSVFTTVRFNKKIYCSGKTCELSQPKRSFVLVFFQISMSCILIFPTMTTSASSLTVYAIMLGTCYGGLTPLPNTVIIDMFGTSRIASAMGYRSLATGISFLTFPVIIGYLIDTFGTYTVAQYSTSMLCGLAAILTFTVQMMLIRQGR